MVPDAAPAMTLTLDVGRRCTLRLASFGLACCAVEFVAASVGDPALLGRSAPASGEHGEIEVLVVSGTVTDKIAPAVRALYDRMPEPRRVISFGACANSGGPYWDSYSVTKGVDQILPVDLYVPGCPPRPEALLGAVLQLAGLAAPARAHSTSAPVRPTTARTPVGPRDLRRRLPPAAAGGDRVTG